MLANYKSSSLAESVESHLHATNTSSGDVESDWSSFKEAVHTAAQETLGPSVRKHQDWFDENSADIEALRKEKHHLHTLGLDK